MTYLGFLKFLKNLEDLYMAKQHKIPGKSIYRYFGRLLMRGTLGQGDARKLKNYLEREDNAK